VGEHEHGEKESSDEWDLLQAFKKPCPRRHEQIRGLPRGKLGGGTALISTRGKKSNEKTGKTHETSEKKSKVTGENESDSDRKRKRKRGGKIGTD